MAKRVKNENGTVNVPEIKLRYDTGNFVSAPPKINEAKDAVAILRALYNKEEIELHEIMFVLFLTRGNRVLGFYKHTVGGTTSTVVDSILILGTALKSLSHGLILAHNHPGGNPKPSDADLRITDELKKAAKFFNIVLLDHIILTKQEHHSFADVGLMGFPSTYPDLTPMLKTETANAINKEKKIALELQKQLRQL